MNDLISRAAQLDIIKRRMNADGIDDEAFAELDSLECEIEEMPAVDAEPVRHGRLVSTGFDEIYCEWGDCTVCGSDNRINANFCNNCGAKIEGTVTKMDGEEYAAN